MTTPASNPAGLTARQSEIVGFVRQYVVEHGFPPSLREIAAAFEIHANAVAAHLDAAAKRGVIRRSRRVARGLALVSLREGGYLQGG